MWTGRRLLVWATYAPGYGTTSDYNIYEAQVVAAWTPGSDRWQLLPSQPRSVSTYGATAIWTGTSVLFPDASSCPPYADCPPPPDERPVNGYDPAANTWHSSPPSVIAATPGPLVWTGDALVVISAIGGPGATTFPGDGTAIDPGLTRWSSLPRCPVGRLDDAQAVWTGHELLVWDGLSSSGAPTAEVLLPATAPTSP